MRSCDIEVIQRHSHKFTTSVMIRVDVEGLDMVRDGQFLRLVLSNGADLESDQDVFAR